MTELFIDGHRAVINNNVSIKLTKENVYFTKASSYTFDIELPMSCAENVVIFGHINRKDVEAKIITRKAKLYSDNILLLDGTAVVTQVTDLAVKVQLLAGNSEMNFYHNAEKQYVDELPMSDWFSLTSGVPWLGDQVGSSYTFAYLNWMDYFKIGGPLYPYAGWRNMLWGLNNAWVAFPIYNETAEVQCNDYVMRKRNTDFQVEFRMSHEGMANLANGDPQVKFAIQPYLHFIVERVIRAMGYTIYSNSNELYNNDFFNKIFVANANNRIELNKSLPHWTVNEFITQIENFCGVVFKVDEASKNVRIISRNDYMKQGTYYINDVVDEYTIDIDKEETTDISNGNIGYSDGDIDQYDMIEEDIISAATFDREYTTLESLSNFVINSGLKKSDKKKIYECEGRHFIVVADGLLGSLSLKEVNIFRNRIQNQEKKDVDIELKIVPCKIIETEISAVETKKNGSNIDVDTKLWTTSCRCLSRPDRNDFSWSKSNAETDEVDIADMIENETEKETANDMLYVALNDGKLQDIFAQTATTKYPVPYTKEDIAINNFGILNNKYQNNLGLHSMPLKKNIGSEVIDKQAKIDTTVKYCFQFIANSVYDPSYRYVIQNKEYVCEKIEPTIKATGIDKLVTGYFYQLK